MTLNTDDGTLDRFVQQTAHDFGIDLDDKSQDWGGVFGIMFSGDSDYTEDEARTIMAAAKRIYGGDQ